MGRNNRNKIQSLVMPELVKRFGHIYKIGGYTCQEPVAELDGGSSPKD